MHITNRKRTASTILQNRIGAIIRTKDQTLAQRAMHAAVEGGFRSVEFTMTTPGVLELIAGFRKNNELTVGAGTVMTPQQATDAVSAGAQFLVSPITDAEVLARAATLDVPIIPGASTPSEMEAAHRLGADFVKVFPAPAGGVNFIRAVLGPLPHLRLYPTAGVDPENFVEFLNVGCAGVGFVASLFVPTDLAEGKFEAIRQRAQRIVSSLVQWRSTR